MNSSSWASAKELIDQMLEPSPDVAKHAKKTEGGTHSQGKTSHSLVQYQYDFSVKNYPAQFIWSVCPECRIVWRKYLVVFNNKKNTVYQKVVTHKGKPVDL